ncbi:NAD(P)/FAD-dependent oxidoreductase [Acetobacteraceae bacterium]|nr:NAD(P)/FAD-dependent oxidoreductase [Acetobacteraceae bacterium]
MFLTYLFWLHSHEEYGYLKTRNIVSKAEEKTIQKIVVLGGGIGGINVLRDLKHLSNISATLIDPNPFHVCKPSLHEVAAGTLTSKDNRFAFKALATEFGFNFIQAKALSIDTISRKIQLSSDTEIAYDWLIVACGAVPNDFKTEGADQHCYFLNNIADADVIYSKVRLGVTSAFQEKKSFNVAIIGAGPTGVQLTAALYETFTKKETISPHSISLQIIEGQNRLLPSFHKDISEGAARRLKELNIQLNLNAKVEAIRENGVALANGTFLPADMVIWTAGVKPNITLKKLFPDLEFGRNGGLVVTNTLQTTKDPHILAIGDCAFILKSPLPPTAQAARKEGIYLQKIALPALISGKTPKPFIYNNQGSIVVLGKYAGWGELPSGKSFGGKGLGNRWAQLLHSILSARQQYELGGLTSVLKKFLKKKFL